MNTQLNFSLIYTLSVVSLILIVILIINSIRISRLTTKIQNVNDTTNTLIEKKHHHNLFDLAENKSDKLKIYYKNLIADKLAPMLFDYLNKYLEINEIYKYLDDNSEKINKIIDLIVEKGYNELETMKKSEDGLAKFITSLDLDYIINYIESN